MAPKRAFKLAIIEYQNIFKNSIKWLKSFLIFKSPFPSYSKKRCHYKDQSINKRSWVNPTYIYISLYDCHVIRINGIPLFQSNIILIIIIILVAFFFVFFLLSACCHQFSTEQKKNQFIEPSGFDSIILFLKCTRRANIIFIFITTTPYNIVLNYNSTNGITSQWMECIGKIYKSKFIIVHAAMPDGM